MTGVVQQKKRVGIDLTDGPILKTLIVFAIPIIITNLVQLLYGMVDLIIIGQYCGSVGTVGVSTGGEMSDLMTPIASAFSTAGQIYIAQLVGAREEKSIQDTIGTLLTLMIGISAVMMAGTIVFNSAILKLLNCPPEAEQQAATYMMITAVGMPFVFGYNAICGVLRGMGESKRPLLFVLVAASVNVVVDYVFVAIFKMEAAGAAIATVLSQMGSCAAAFFYLYKRRGQFDFRLSRSYFKIQRKPLIVLLKLGLPMLVRIIAVQYSMLWVKANVNSYGLVVSATNSVGGKLEKFLNIFVQGVDGGAGAMMGQNLGARKYERTKKIVFTTLGCTMVFAVFSASAALLIPRTLFGIFTSDQAVIDYGVTYMSIIAVSYFVSAFCSSFKALITGAGEVILGLFVGILDGVICRIGISLFCVYVLDLGATGYFWGTALCQVVPGIVCLGYFVSGKWRTKKLLVNSKQP